MQMLNISKKIYVGWSTSTDGLPDVEITPVGNAVNEKNRVKKLTNRYKDTREYDNEALPGFTLLRSESRGYTSREVDWLVIDPRGFICRITSDNMNKILSISGITEGLIQEKCVWARNDNETKLSLIPMNSPGYEEAVKNTALIENKVSKSEIKIGDVVLLQNGMQGRYMGTESLYGAAAYQYSSYNDYSGKVTTWCRRQIIETKKDHFYFGTDIKMLKVIDPVDEPMTREEAVKYMNDRIAKGAYFTNREGDDGKQFWSKPGQVKLVSSAAIAKPTLSFEEITKDEAAALYKECYRVGDKYRVVLENNVGKFIIDMPWNGNKNGAVPTEFLAEPIKGLDSTNTLVMMSRGRNTFNSFGSKSHVKLDDFTKFYKIVKHVKTDSYV